MKVDDEGGNDLERKISNLKFHLTALPLEN